MTEFTLEPCAPEDITSRDLRGILTATDAVVECYLVLQDDDDGYLKPVTGSMLWFPDEGRAGIEFGADADWIAAGSPPEAIALWQAGEEQV